MTSNSIDCIGPILDHSSLERLCNCKNIGLGVWTSGKEVTNSDAPVTTGSSTSWRGNFIVVGISLISLRLTSSNLNGLDLLDIGYWMCQPWWSLFPDPWLAWGSVSNKPLPLVQQPQPRHPQWLLLDSLLLQYQAQAQCPPPAALVAVSRIPGQIMILFIRKDTVQHFHCLHKIKWCRM